jgi:16S rRNA pseudouridine516 synthase
MQKSRLDKFLISHLSLSKREVRLMLAQKRVHVDGQFALDIAAQINKFSLIEIDGNTLQKNDSIYIMLNKPIGVISATKDKSHKTVIDLISHPQKAMLHIVGRLDLNTSGLILLTNDSQWSEKLTQPKSKVAKVYHVTVQNKLTTDYIYAFEQGMYFDYEDITTKPAKLIILSDYTAQVSLTEGRYHQIKRMFGRFQNPVTKLHRSKVGNLSLDPILTVGDSRSLSSEEVANIALS